MLVCLKALKSVKSRATRSYLAYHIRYAWPTGPECNWWPQVFTHNNS